jgi:hypothetical protein
MVKRLRRSGRVIADTPESTKVLPDGPGTVSGAILTSEEASRYLWQCWRLQRSPRRLAQLRALPVGAGPAFHRDGCAVRYRKRSLDTWATKQLGAEHGNTSVESAARQVDAA